MRRIGLFIALLAAGGCHRQPAPAPQATPEAAAPEAAAAPYAVSRDSAGKAPPPTEIDALAGGKVTLAGFKGQPLLVNLWATWCGPCVRELPTLDKLAATGGALKVVAISEDQDGAKVVTPFLAQHGIKTLAAYHDNDNGLMLAFKEASLPVTILYGADGKEKWRVRGDLDWGGAEAKKLLAEAGS